MRSPDDYAPKSTVAGYDLSSIEGIEADIAAMEDFAAGLKADLMNNYAPHAATVSEAMFTTVPVNPKFHEWHTFMFAHQQVQDLTQTNVELYYDGTDKLATAVQDLSAKYRDTDAFSRATLTDVNKEFEKLNNSKSPTGGDSNPSGDSYKPSGEV